MEDVEKEKREAEAIHVECFNITGLLLSSYKLSELHFPR